MIDFNSVCCTQCPVPFQTIIHTLVGFCGGISEDTLTVIMWQFLDLLSKYSSFYCTAVLMYIQLYSNIVYCLLGSILPKFIFHEAKEGSHYHNGE